MKLRMPKPRQPLHVVLIEPEIPQNTGNIARLCAATGTLLHLVGPLGFRIDEKSVRRAGLDYWHLVHVEEHADLESCLDRIGQISPLFFSAHAPRSYLSACYQEGCPLVFGKETKGFNAAIREKYSDSLYAIPTVRDSVRSLNLANAVSIVLYEALRSIGALEKTAVQT